MKNIIILLFLILPCSYIIGQNQDSIVYIVPDSVEIMLNKEIQSRKSYRKDIDCGLYLSKGSNGMFTLHLIEYNDFNFHLKNSNRYLLVDSTKYPLLFDYDIEFASYGKREIREMGSRFDGVIPKNYYIIEGYSISFDLFGKNIKENLGIYKKK